MTAAAAPATTPEDEEAAGGPAAVVTPAAASSEELREAGLRYVSDEMPGIARRRAGTGFAYRAPDGRTLRDKAVLGRIKALAIPPAWREVWISPFPDGHLQAVGRDEKGRKQYRYHPRWRELRDGAKFEHMLAFARALPRVRATVEADLAKPGLGRRKVMAAVVRLLETTLIRVGNDEYARANKSYGLTTLRDRHFSSEGSRLRFRFRGKSGQQHTVEIQDRRLARLVRRTQELPGQELFQYLDGDGKPTPVDSAEVNAYLREAAGGDFTAKDFRTWAATVLAAWALRELEAFDTKAAAKRNVTRAIERAAARLGNTPAICRKSYVHPEVVNAYLDGALLEHLKAEVEAELKEDLAGLAPEEAAVLAFLQRRLARESSSATAGDATPAAAAA